MLFRLSSLIPHVVALFFFSFSLFMPLTSSVAFLSSGTAFVVYCCILVSSFCGPFFSLIFLLYIFFSLLPFGLKQWKKFFLFVCLNWINSQCGILFFNQQPNIEWLSYIWFFNVSFGCCLCSEISFLISNSVVVSIISGLERMLLFTDYLAIIWVQLKDEVGESRVAKCT